MNRKEMHRGDFSFENGELKIAQKDNVEEISVSDVIENKTEKQENNNENGVDLEELEKQYALRDSKVEDALKDVKDDIRISEKGIKAALKGEGVFKEVSYSDGRILKQEQEKAEKKIEEMENEALIIPKGKEGKILSTPELKRDISKIIQEMEHETRELLKKFKEKRKQFVEKQAEETLDEAGSQYNYIFRDRDIKNGRNAEEIILYKIEKEIRVASKEFIETGDEAKFGIIRMAVRISSYKEGDEENETERKYVTGFIINVGGYEKKIGEKYSPEGIPLVLHSDRKKIEKKSQRGTVERKMV